KDGKVFFPKSDSDVFYVKAEKNSQRSFVKISDMTLNTSNYDVGGIEIRKNDLRFFAYTERGIYRPGDEINFTAIIRNQQNTFPENHPVILRMYNPRNNLIYEQINKEGIDGVYVFKVKTSKSDFTGNWTANFVVAGETFTIPVKIETIVPYTIKARMTSSEQKLTAEKRLTTIDIDVQYLVGLPASGLSYSVNVEYLYPPKKFSNLPTYNFDDKSFSTDIKSEEYIASGTIDINGKAKFDYGLPEFDIKPSSMICLFSLKVIEKSGRPVIFKLAIPVEFYQYYVGYKLPSSYGAYAKQGSSIPISIVDLKSDGSYAKGRKIKWTAYHSRWWWWWDYYYNSDFALNFKNRESTSKYSNGTLSSIEGPTTLNLKFEDYGTYYIELEEEEGHKSSFFVFVYGWGMDTSSKDANFLILRSDKKEYKPGENAIVSFPASKTGKVFVSIEHGNKIVNSYWVDSKVDENMEMNINIPIDNTMTPNIYVIVMLIQPHSETSNDRPIRMFGILPLNVVDVTTKQEIDVKVADVIKPNKPFTIEIQTKDNKPAQMTVAVVDEGLLDLTAFETPDPWKEFNKKLKMGVKISDLYDNIIDLNTGNVKNRFSVGGSDELTKFAKAQSADSQAERFKPVSFFKGPLKTDENGYLKVSFDMPNYIGSVRIMVISINGNRYGSFEKAVKVREELMVSASLPRILRPTDSIKVPVTILAMEKNLGKITVTATVNGEAKIIGDNKQEIIMTKEGEQTIYFNLTANEAVGLIEFNVEATNGKYFSSQKTQLDCIAGSARLYGSDYFAVAKGESKKFKIPVFGIKGSNQAEIIISTLLPKNLQKRLSYLIHYPYGCIEQTVSGAFPQLYLPELIELSKEDREKIDSFINAAIMKIRKMQISSGAFSYWPDSSYYNLWTTHYAAHFLIEAKNKGYDVPSDMIEKWQDFAKKSLKKDIGNNIVVSTYACYLLALSGKPDVASMNIIWTLYKEKLSEPYKLLLSASYKLAGSTAISSNVFSLALKKKYQEYSDNDETFGSKVRDDGLTLLAYMALDKDYEANQLFNEIIKEIQTDSLYSTQETAFLLLSMGKYITEKASAFDSNGKKGVIQGTITYPSGKKVNFSTEKKSIKIPIESDFGKEFIIQIDSKTNIPVVYVDVISTGIPLMGATTSDSNKIIFEISYYDENGILVKNNKFQKGKQYWVQIAITNLYSYRYNNIAIAHLLPAGLEYDQYRATYKNKPEFDKEKWGYIQPQYIDIRDDRAFIFANIWRDKSVFYLKVNAVTVGKFLMPSSFAEAMYNNNVYSYTAAGYCEVVDNISNPLAKPKN
ncbi:MAG: MG2 domain-containing protein, partial [Spirochaetota bacterium]